MPEDLGKEIAIEAAKAVAVEGYKDTLQPALKAVGSVIALPFQAIDVALSKPKLWVAEKHYNYERTRQLLAEKLQHTPEELIVPPENYVAVPALQQIAYCFDSDELRDMYANLLANSMNKFVKNGVHPSFVEIIKQLSPDEAKLLGYINRQETGIPMVFLNVRKKSGGTLVLDNGFTNATELCGCDYPLDGEKYLDNLERLGLLKRSQELYFINRTVYRALKEHSYIALQKKHIEMRSDVEKVEYIEGSAELTQFGKSFCKMCIGS